MKRPTFARFSKCVWSILVIIVVILPILYWIFHGSAYGLLFKDYQAYSDFINLYDINLVNSIFAIALGSFSISTMLYIFLLERSHTTYSGYYRKNFTSGIHNGIFLSQICYIAVTATLILFKIHYIRMFTFYSLIISLILSIWMIGIVLLVSRDKHNQNLLKNWIKRIIESLIKGQAATDSSAAKKEEHLLFLDIQRKAGCEEGKEYAKNEIILDESLVLYLYRKLIIGLTETKQLNKKGFTKYYTFFYNVTQHLIMGFSEIKKEDSEQNTNLLIKMFLDFYTKVFDDNTQISIQNKLLAVNSIICCFLDNLSEYGVERFFTRLYNYSLSEIKAPEGYLSRLIFSLYARGYYQAVSGQNEPSWIFKYISYYSVNLSEQVKKDIKFFWQILSEIDHRPMYQSASEEEAFICALEMHYGRTKKISKSGRQVYKLLFGNKEKRYLG